MTTAEKLSPNNLAPRNIGPVNWVGLYTLTRKETQRFFVVYLQTIIAPVISTILFYAVFSIALGGAGKMAAGIPYMDFLTPGLIMMAMAQNAFANTSSSMVISKVQGNIVDVLMPPLTATEFAIGYTLGGLIRGVVIGIASIIVVAPFSSIPLHDPLYIIFHGVMGSAMMALLGLIGGIWSMKFDHLATVTNFIIMPATFLSGTFYTASQLPEMWRFICHLNPFFYMIDGFRYGFTGVTDGSLSTGIVVMIAVNIVLWALTLVMLKKGYKLKS
ncbi:MAG: ABC transporter permease [Alphaproteobacteria bacterium]|nr:ABC transporter permease [Alphaproteobacteria bacterium]